MCYYYYLYFIDEKIVHKSTGETQYFPKISECAEGGFKQSQSYLAILSSILNVHRIVVSFKRCRIYSKCSTGWDLITCLAEFRQTL